MSEISNMEKYSNYKEQMGRLKKAIDNHFLLEALFIEYAVIEDRLLSTLRHSGKKVNEKASVYQKVEKIRKLLNSEHPILSKYFDTELLDGIICWKDERNTLIHSLMKQSLTSEELEDIVARGQIIVKTLCSKSTSYKRALEREQKKKEETKQ